MLRLALFSFNNFLSFSLDIQYNVKISFSPVIYLIHKIVDVFFFLKDGGQVFKFHTPVITIKKFKSITFCIKDCVFITKLKISSQNS